MHFNRIRHIMVALLAMFAFGAVVATAAQAEEAPSWSIKGKRLAKGETHYITGKAYKDFTYTHNGLTLRCSMMKFKEGVLLGSEATEPGTNDEVVEFEDCTIEVKGGETCPVPALVTTPLKSELVEDVTGKKLYIELFPNVGTTWLQVKTGSECKTKEEFTVKGSVVGEVRTDPHDGELGELVELPNMKKQATSWLINFPSTPITKILLLTGGKGSEVTVGLENEVGFAGTALVLLANAKRESVEEEWSPLP